jgi:nucleoside-diphosphate-sugar epimerase
MNTEMRATHPADHPGKRVMVTGGSGFIGSHLCRQLASEGYEVYSASRTAPADVPASVRWVSLDVNDPPAIAKVISDLRPDIVYHLAAQVTGARDRAVVLPTFQTNLASTVALLDSVAQVGCQRVILPGSMDEPVDAPDAAPPSPYGASRWACSAYSRMFHQLYKTPIVIVRPMMVYGPGQKDLMKIVPYIILSVLRKQTPKLGSCARPVDWVYIDDVVEAFVAAATAPGVEGRTMELGCAQTVTVRAVVENIVALMGSDIRPEFGAIADRPMEKVRVAQIEAAWEFLHWRPKTSLEEGLRRTIDWYSEQQQKGSTGPT